MKSTLPNYINCIQGKKYRYIHVTIHLSLLQYVSQSSEKYPQTAQCVLVKDLERVIPAEGSDVISTGIVILLFYLTPH